MPCRCLNCRIHDLDTGFKCRTRSNERILKSVLLFRIIQIEWDDSLIIHSIALFAATTYDILCGSRAVLPTVPILSLTALFEISLPTRSWAVGTIKSLSVDTCACPITTALNLRNSSPCSGFVKKSASISPVGQCTTEMPSEVNRSLIKKYLAWNYPT